MHDRTVALKQPDALSRFAGTDEPASCLTVPAP